MLLGKRFANDSKATLKLNELQLANIEVVRRKIDSGTYKMEAVPCAVCNSTSFESLANKDRYGFQFDFVICKNCGLAQTNPRMNQQAYNEFYDKEYRFIYGGEEGPSETFFIDQYFRLGKKIYDFIATYKPVKNSFVLEIGCGAGGILKYFRDQGCIVKGIDLGSEFVSYGKNIHGLDLDVLPLSDLTLAKKPDIIIYSHVLEHILDLNGQLALIRNIMHENTLLYIEVPGLKNLHQSYNSDLLLYLQNAHVYHFTKTSLLNVMKKNGFSEIHANEYVRSIFMLTNAEQFKTPTNEYASTVTYLKKIEWMHNILPVPWYVLKYRTKRAIYNILSALKLVPSLQKEQNQKSA